MSDTPSEYEEKTIVPGVEAAKFRGGEGVWVSHGDRNVGLVEDQSGEGYLCIWKSTSTENLPLAITHDGIQLPRPRTPDSPYVTAQEYKFINWTNLFRMVEAFNTGQLVVAAPITPITPEPPPPIPPPYA